MEETLQLQLPFQYYVRTATLDDIDALTQTITPEGLKELNQLFDYPNLMHLYQSCFISFTVLNQDHEIIGTVCFDDYPPGPASKFDDLHYNLWEQWLSRAYNLEGLPISSNNTLWLTYMYVNPSFIEHAEVLSQKVFQNLYVMQPQLDGILFLQRSQVDELQTIDGISEVVKGHFLELRVLDRQVLKRVVGIGYRSRIYYSPKSHIVEDMEIRMAREEDHDDLAQIFNKQSQVLTSQFGEFFIADLIATQNLTRRMNKGSQPEGKAVVGQVGEKAIGLMSISTEIDYNLLNNYFDLNIFDNLIKPELMEAIHNRYEQIAYDQQKKKKEQQQLTRLLIYQERIKSLKVGQRIIFQQFCIEQESEIKLDLSNIQNSLEVAKALDIEGFEALLNKWTSGFQLYLPSEIFRKHPEYAKDLESYILSPAEFFIETLEFFGLPKNYMKKEGHWKDWAKKIIEDNMAAQLRRPRKHAKKDQRKGRKDKKEDNNLIPPDYFDISPFVMAFNKFVSVGADTRASFREQLKEKQKIGLMLFCDEDGQMVNEKNIDLSTLGKLMNDNGIAVAPVVCENMRSMLEAFGEIKYHSQTVKVQQKIQQKKNMPIKKEAEPKYIDVVREMVSYSDFMKAMEKIKTFDNQLYKLGYLKSGGKPEEETEKQPEQERKFNFGKYGELVKNLGLNELPNIPFQAYNAIVINLFCIDQIYESRSLDFVEFSFSNLFPDKEYIIITQPFTVPENTLVKHFIQVPRKKSSTFQHCLYIFHKDALFYKELQVRRSLPNDVKRAKYLMQDMLNKQQIEREIKDSIANPSSQLQSFTVNCSGELVGLYTISKTVNLDYYTSHFFVQDHIILSEHPRNKHGKLVYSFINPLFIKSVRFIMREMMRLANKTCLYFEVHTRTLLPDIFNEFTPLRMRIFPHFIQKKWDFEFQKQDLERRQRNLKGADSDRNPQDELEAPFSLSMIVKKELNTLKTSNNTRIIVVGASDTGISFIQSLLILKNINFTNVTLLAPGGLITMHVKTQKDLLKCASTSYTFEELKNLMIDARITVMDAKMVKLDKKEKKILIDKNAHLSYDILVLSVGLIDTLLQNEGLISSGQATSPYYKDRKFIQGVYSIDDPYLHRDFALDSKNIRLLKRKKKPQSITIYGCTPHTVAFVSGLISRGVPAQRIYYVSPGNSRRRMTFFESNQERIEYQSQLINNPNTFQDINVQKMVIDQLRLIGVNVYLCFQFYEFDGDPCKGIRFRKKADNYEQLEEMINKKRFQINLKMQEMGNRMAEEDEDSEDLEKKISPEKEIEMMQERQWELLYTPSCFFITSGLIDIDREIFNIIHQNGLVYNGRLIVKSNFQTTENQIFACGRICEFSQRYKNFCIGKSLRLDRYNGRELGSTLCKHVLSILNLSYLSTQKYTEDQLPKFYMPVGIGSALFGGMVYYHIKKTDYSLPKAVIDKGCKPTELISKNIDGFSGHYIKFTISPHGLIESVSYFGSEQVVVPSLNSFIGLSVEYLNRITKRNDSGLISDIAQFLSENWAICLYHEFFSQFRHYLKKAISTHPIAERLNNRAGQKAREGHYTNQIFMNQIKALIPPDIIEEIRNGTISFIEYNKNHLPMYYVPIKRVA